MFSAVMCALLQKYLLIAIDRLAPTCTHACDIGDYGKGSFYEIARIKVAGQRECRPQHIWENCA